VPWAGQKRLPEADALLLHAYAIHKASLCPCGCGFPAKITLDEDAEGCVEIDDTARCAVRAALDEWESENRERREPGTLIVPVLDEKSYRIVKARRSGAGSERH
jgi:hypothetical protein